MNYLAALCCAAAAITWDLSDLAGQRHQYPARTGSESSATVLIFAAPGCTISERARPLVEELHAEFHSGRVSLVTVIPGRWSAELLGSLKLAAGIPVLIDPDLTLTRRAAVRVTPEAVLLDARGQVRYRGRLESQGRNHVREALVELLGGKPVSRPAVAAQGCAISGLAPRVLAARPAGGSGVTGWQGVAPVLRKHCIECHQSGGAAPFSLARFADAAPRAAAIAEAVTTRRMPPWKPDPGPPHFLGERRLSPLELRALTDWNRAGAPEGDPAMTLPSPVEPPQQAIGPRLGPPGHTARMRATFPVPAGGPDLYRCFVLPSGLDQRRWVRAYEFRPGDPRAVHHALIFVDRSRAARRRDAETPEPGYPCFGVPGFLPSSALGGWAPGTGAVEYPEGSAVLLTPDSDLVLQLHYAPGGQPRSDQSEVGLYFTETPPTRRMMEVALGSRAIDIPAGAPAYRVRDHFTLPVEVMATGIIPHAHFLAKTMRGWAILPDGRRINLLTIRDWDFNWQQQYRYREPFRLPADTRLEMEFSYDNSAANPRNPSSPPRRVTWGPDSTDEMAGLHLQVTPVRAEDSEELGRALWGKMMREISRGDGADRPDRVKGSRLPE